MKIKIDNKNYKLIYNDGKIGIVKHYGDDTFFIIYEEICILYDKILYEMLPHIKKGQNKHIDMFKYHNYLIGIEKIKKHILIIVDDKGEYVLSYVDRNLKYIDKI